MPQQQQHAQYHHQQLMQQQQQRGHGPSFMRGFAPRCEWELDPRQVLVGRRLAVGGFAEVFLGKYEVSERLAGCCTGLCTQALQDFGAVRFSLCGRLLKLPLAVMFTIPTPTRLPSCCSLSQ